MPSIYCNCIEDILWHKVYGDVFGLTSAADIWRTQISDNLPLINRFDHILSEGEKARASRYHQEKDKQRFIISRIVLRFLLAKYSNNDPEKIEFATGSNKKPFVQNASAVDLYYNISHSGDVILIAVSDSDIGIDVERIDVDFSYSEILRQNFNTEEIGFINRGKQPAENFFLLWTRKEALLKATSKGIDSDLPFIPSLDGKHDIDQKIMGSGKDFCVSSFKVTGNYMGSIAYKPGYEKIRFRDIDQFFFPH